MNLNQLIYFAALGRLEHYTRAAEELDVSQPALSQSISALERELGVFLFERQGRNVVLTKSGKLFLKYVESALSQIKTGVKEMKDLKNLEKGHINLAFISTVGAFFVPRLISGFLNNEQFKNITFSCAESNTKQLMKGLKDGTYDLAICSRVEKETDYEFISIIEQDVVMLVPVSHQLASKRSITLEEARDFPFILHTHESGMRAIENDLFGQAGFEPMISCEVEVERTIAGLVAANMGIALVSDGPDIENFDIKVLPVTEPFYKRYIYLVTLKNRILPPAVHLFKSYVLQHMKII